MQQIIETSLSIEFKDLHPKEMEFFKECFAKMIDIKNKIIIPGQIIINIDENSIISSVDIKGRVFKRRGS